MADVNLYQSSVRSLSDEELERLSSELEEEYCCSGYEDSYWTDDAAEERYREIGREVSRRKWAALHPEDPEGLTRPVMSLETLNRYTRDVLAALADNLVVSARFTSGYDQQFTKKIGDRITVRRPEKFSGLLPADPFGCTLDS